MASDVKWPTTTEMSRLEAWPTRSSSRCASQSFHWRRATARGAQCQRRTSLKARNSCVNGKLVRLQAESVGSFQNSVPNFPDVCRSGANRSGVADVDRQHGRASCPPAQETGARRHERLETGWSGRRQARVHSIGITRNCEKMASCHRPALLPPSRSRSHAFPSRAGRKTFAAPPRVRSGRTSQPTRTSNSGASPQAGSPILQRMWSWGAQQAQEHGSGDWQPAAAFPISSGWRKC